MTDTRSTSYAILLLRIATGVLFLAHASLKIFVFTPAGTVQFFQSLGFPAWMAYFTILWEVIGGIALIVGIWPRLAALIMIPDLLGAIFTVHGAAGFFFTNANGGWEYPAFWIVGLLAIVLLGDGPSLVKSPFSSHRFTRVG